MDGAEPIKALGSLFKSTEVYLWDNSPTEVREIPYFQEPVKRKDGDDFEMHENNSSTEFILSLDDVDLAKQLNELGLPFSFQTKKERNGKVSGKRKDIRKKNCHSRNDIDVRLLDSIKVSEEERNLDILHDNLKLNQNEILKCDNTADIDGFHSLCSEGKDLSCCYDFDCSSVFSKRKKKVRRTKSNRNLSISSEELQGIWEEFSPTYRSKHVIAIDIDPNKIGYAQHNAFLYRVDDRIDFIRGDSFCLAPRLKADIVFMSPPWGGPDYAKVKKFDIYTMLKPHDGQFLFNAGKDIASRIIMFLPRNVDISQLAELSLSASPPWSLEVEKNFLNGRFKAITAYFSAPALS